MKTTSQIKRFARWGMLRALLGLLLVWLGGIQDALAFPPQITTQPTSRAVQVGSNTTFNLVATTSNGALTYQWYFQAARIIGATSSSYTLTNAQLTNAGIYYVAVTNADGGLFSSNATLTVNDAPVLSGANDLPSIFPNDVNNAGTSVTNLIAGKVSDPNPGALQGIAVVAVDNANGSWQYSTNGGAQWAAFGTPTETGARLLRADASSRVRLVPNANYVGTVTNGLTFRAWDQTSATNGASVAITLRSDNVLDQFNTESYDNNNGSQLWNTSWLETEAGGSGPSAGLIKILNSKLQISTANVGDNLARQANLSGATAATLTYLYDASSLSLGGNVQVQVSSNGGSTFTTLKTYTPSSGSGTESFNITSQISSNTQVRFYVSGSQPASSIFRADDVQITYSSPGGGATAFSTNTASASVTVVPAADVITTMTGPANVYAGSNFTYTITVTNPGPSTATNVVVSDILPAGLAVVSASGGGNIVAVGGLGQVVFDRASAVAVTNQLAGSTNWTHVTTDGANRLLLVGISGSRANSTNFSVNTVTYGGVELTKVQTVTNVFFRSELWQLVNPPSGSNNVSLTFSGLPKTLIAGAATFSGVDLATPLGYTVALGGSANSFSNTLFSGTNEMVFDNMAAQGGSGAVPGAGQTQLWNLSGPDQGVSTIKPGANATTMSWAVAGGNWAYVAAAVRSAPLIGAVTWTLPTLAAGAATNFTLTVTAPLSGTLSNVISSTATTTDSNPVNNDGSAGASQVVTTVLPLADLITTQSGLTSIAPLANYTYTVTVSNAGPTAASGVAVTDTLAPSLTYVSSSGGGSSLGGVVTWPTVANLPRGGSTNFTVTVRAPISGTLTTIAASTSATADPNAANNNGSAPEAQVITAVSPLEVANTSKGAAVQTLNWSHTVDPGSSRILIVGLSIDSTTATVNSATFAGFPTLTLIGQTNSGSTRVLLYRMLNPQVGTYPISISLSTAVGIVGGAVSFNGVNQTTPIAAFAGRAGSGTNASLSVTSALGGVVIDVIAPKSPQFATNAGSAQSEQWNLSGVNYSGAGSSSYGANTVTPTWELDNAANWAMAAVALNSATVLADVTVSLTGPASVIATSNLTYSLTVTNLGSSSATNVVVSYVLPAGATLVSASSGGTANGNVVSWPALASLAVNGRSNYTVTIKAPASGTMTNIIYGTSTTADPDPSNNNGSGASNRVVTTVTPQADLATTVTGPASVLAGAQFNYTVTVTNAGPSPADNVVVSNTLPAAATFVSASDGGTYDAGVVTWPFASLASGATSNFTVTVTAPASGTLSNSVASTSAATDLVPSNNNGSSPSARVITTVTPQADIATTVTGPASVQAAAQFSYTITVTNAGPSTADTVLVSNTLPAAVQFVSASGGGSNNAGVVTWSLANLLTGAASNFTVTVTAPDSGMLTNAVASASATSDPIPSNNDGSSPSAQVITTVMPSADIATTVTGPTSVLTNATFSYTITVTNLGPATASGVVVRDTLPAGVIFVSASDGGTQDAGVVTWPELVSMASGEASTFTLTITAPGSGYLTNRVSSVSGIGDPDSSNNDGSALAATLVTGVYPSTLLTGHLLPGGDYQIEFQTFPNTVFSIETSTNLVDWVTLITTNSGDGNVIFVNEDVPLHPMRFYRSRQ